MNYEQISLRRTDDMVKLWNQEIGTDFPMRKKLLIQNSFKDSNVLMEGSLLVTDDEGELIGFVISKKYSELNVVEFNHSLGWIQVLLVKKANRNKGIGTELLKRAEAALSERGVKKILLGKDVWHYFPGIPNQYGSVKRWFDARGYQFNGIEFDLLTEKSSNSPQLSDVSIAPIAGKDDATQFLSFLHRIFPGRWEYEAIKYFEYGGSGKEFILLKKENKIIGFCRANGPDSPQIAQNVYWAPLFEDGLGGIGPLGLDSEVRGNGYGLAIVQASIAYLNQRGLKRVIIDWTRLVNFYEKVGARPWKTYATYSKNL
ncbi:GNAT family N-acetyltransferase [Sporolactobacillus nakayamae]|uniref:Acetyltransferase (GNAT) domain-containing protein n=1 Tax=Sporolactobacillus nakayamae TaxID=269670 RepID=A0A1I2TCC2_9BACL|nr:GNAT family N-acetyltransferase [Sporolactobacillus nakayamae]SFG62552.1 Acetyltransferase (GNAT) domain-containing protein [Sporolactobacillus nakayamae]